MPVQVDIFGRVVKRAKHEHVHEYPKNKYERFIEAYFQRAQHFTVVLLQDVKWYTRAGTSYGPIKSKKNMC